MARRVSTLLPSLPGSPSASPDERASRPTALYTAGRSGPRHLGGFETWIERRESSVGKVQLSACRLDLPAQLAVTPDHPELYRRPASRPAPIDAHRRCGWRPRMAATAASGPVERPGRPSAPAAPCSAPRPCRMPPAGARRDPRQGGRANCRDQQDQRNGDEQRQRDQERDGH